MAQELFTQKGKFTMTDEEILNVDIFEEDIPELYEPPPLPAPKR